jgi:DNA gyrase subunit A
VGRLPAGATFADLGVEKGEYIVGGGVSSPDHYLVLGTRAGNIKRIRIEDLNLAEASWAAAIGLVGEEDELLFAATAGNRAEVIFFTTGKAIRFAAGPVNPQATPSARGVTAMKWKKKDRLVAGIVFEPDETAQVVIVSQTGFIKRVPLTEFPLQGRGGQGVQSLDITKATGPVVTATVAGGEARYCDVLSARGLRHRLPLADLPPTGRCKRGEQLIDFGPDDLIAGIVTL